MDDQLSFVDFAYIFVTTIERQYVKGRKNHFPDMHIKMCEWLEQTLDNDNEVRLLQVYRHGGKSFLICLYVAWRLYLDPEYTCVIISAVANLADRNARLIRKIIERHPETDHLVPNGTDEWKAERFNVVREGSGLDSSVLSLSLGSDITGVHCEEIIFDDLETSKNVVSEAKRLSIRECVDECTSLANRYLFVGTPHHEDTIYNYVEEELDCIKIKIPVIDANGKPAWPELHSLAWIEKKKGSNTSGRFNSQYLLIPSKAVNTRFNRNMLIEYDDGLAVDIFSRREVFSGTKYDFVLGRDIITDIKAYWDPAFASKKSDNSVLAVVCKSADNNVFIHHIELLPEVNREKGETFEAQCLEVLRVCKEMHCNDVYVETNFAPTLDAELRNVAKAKGSRIRVIPTRRTSNQKKENFIGPVLEQLILAGRLLIHTNVMRSTPFISEFEDFPHSKRDDCLDAVAGAIHELIPTKINQSGLKPITEMPVTGSTGVIVLNTYRQTLPGPTQH